MPFPHTEREIYEVNTLADVVCQLRFPTILEISTKDPADFQNEIRTTFPIYKKDVGADASAIPPELATLLKQLPVQIATTPVHRFMTPDEQWIVSLSNEFLSLNAQNYVRWEDFSGYFTAARTALERIHAPAFYSRVGLRYQNHIDRVDFNMREVPWSQLLQPSILNLMSDEHVGSEVIGAITQALIRIDTVVGGRVGLRHGIVEQGPDRDDGYLIDADFFTAERTTSDAVDQVLRTFNQLAGDLFRWAVTPELRNALRPQQVQ